MHTIKITGGFIDSISSIPTMTMSLRTFPFHTDKSLALSNGIAYKSYPIISKSGVLVVEIQDLPFPEVVFTIQLDMLAPLPGIKPFSNMVARTGKVNTDNGNFIPSELHCLPLKYTQKLEDLQEFLRFADFGNIWFGTIPFQDGLSISNGLFKIKLGCTGIIGTMSGEADFFIRISPADSAIPTRFVNATLDDVKGIGLIKGIVENSFEKHLIDPLENKIDDFLADITKKELKPLNKIIELKFDDKARVLAKGVIINSINPVGSNIGVEGVVVYPIE